MAIVINGSGTVTGLAVGGLPDGTVDDGTLASGISKTSIVDGGNATAITIDASENVGIGTSSPSQKLTLSTGYVQTGNGVGGAGGVKFPYGGNTGTRNWRARTDLVGYGDWGLEQSTTQTGETYATKILIDASGNVLVGATANAIGNAGKVIMAGGAAGFCAITNATSVGGGYYHIGFAAGSSLVGSISGGASSVSYSTTSDYRLKTDAQPMTGASARVLALNPVNFEWIASGTRVDGFLAHEAQAVVPECVTGTKDAMRDEEYEVTAAVAEVRDADDNITTEAVEAVMGTRSVPDYQGIDQSKLVPLLVKVIQELEARLTAGGL